MAWWVLGVAAFPHTLKRAQEEVDAVVGRDRLPTFDDFEELHYIRAMVKEVLRWRPVVCLIQNAFHFSCNDALLRRR